MGKFRASGRGARCRIMERRTGQGWREWAETMPDRDAELDMAAGSRLGISKRFGGIPEVYYMAYMNHRHGLIRQSVLGLQTLSNIVFAMALIMSQPSWAPPSPVTIAGPFTLLAPDGTTVTDHTFRCQWLLGH